MNVARLMKEYNLETDDIRWSLSCRVSERLMFLHETDGPEALIRDIWSGSLEDTLYNMEERWMNNRDDGLSRGILDEGHLRDEMSQMALDKLNR